MKREADQAAGTRWRRRAGGAATSLALHILVLTGLVLALRRPAPPPELAPVLVQLLALQPVAPGRPNPRGQPRRAAAQAPAKTAPPSPLSAPPAAPSGQAAQGPDQGSAGVRGVLRSIVGCSHADFVKLTAAERDGCARRLARSADPDLVIPAPIAPEKRAWFDASLAARHSPGRPAGVGCSLLFQGPKLIAPRRPPHALKLGPLPCYVFPGQGALTEEADIAPPAPGKDFEAPTIPRHHDLDRIWGPAGPPHGEAPAPRLDLMAPAPEPSHPHPEGDQR